ncbi:MAG: hypothetical protein VKL39_18445 [Leptolyngbyaceae bacterium]|nr:hypothetical protein [Leptolyngbyaceae bacterium]
MIPSSTAVSKSVDFSRGWRSLAHSPWLPFALLALGTASNAVYAHTPLVAFAAMSGVVLNRRRAIAIALLIWFVNQIIGFGLRGYPLNTTAFTWGALMGIGTLLVVTFSSIRPGFSQSSWAGHGVWVAIALIGGFVLYQGLIMLAYPVIADGHFMGLDIIAKLFVKQAMWTGAIALGHGALLWQQCTVLHRTQE